VAIPLFQNLCRGVSRRWPGQVVYLLTCCQDRIVKNFEQITLNKEDYDKICEIGKNNRVRYNIPITYSPKWSINLFDEDVETEARADYHVKLE